jgi:hypothetical protein
MAWNMGWSTAGRIKIPPIRAAPTVSAPATGPSSARPRHRRIQSDDQRPGVVVGALNLVDDVVGRDADRPAGEWAGAAVPRDDVADLDLDGVVPCEERPRFPSREEDTDQRRDQHQENSRDGPEQAHSDGERDGCSQEDDTESVERTDVASGPVV